MFQGIITDKKNIHYPFKEKWTFVALVSNLVSNQLNSRLIIEFTEIYEIHIPTYRDIQRGQLHWQGTITLPNQFYKDFFTSREECIEKMSILREKYNIIILTFQNLNILDDFSKKEHHKFRRLENRIEEYKNLFR